MQSSPWQWAARSSGVASGKDLTEGRKNEPWNQIVCRPASSGGFCQAWASCTALTQPILSPLCLPLQFWAGKTTGWFHYSLQLLLLSRFSHVRLCATPSGQPTRLHRPWDSPGKNTGVGCHFLLQCMTVKSESEVTQSCLTLSDSMDCSLPGSSVHGIFQARVLEWGAIAFSELASRKSSINISFFYYYLRLFTLSYHSVNSPGFTCPILKDFLDFPRLVRP